MGTFRRDHWVPRPGVSQICMPMAQGPSMLHTLPTSATSPTSAAAVSSPFVPIFPRAQGGLRIGDGRSIANPPCVVPRNRPLLHAPSRTIEHSLLVSLRHAAPDAGWLFSHRFVPLPSLGPISFLSTLAVFLRWQLLALGHGLFWIQHRGSRQLCRGFSLFAEAAVLQLSTFASEVHVAFLAAETSHLLGVRCDQIFALRVAAFQAFTHDL
mmetsp:Transcript_41018/g.64753  ORF Transcript_41018/g.64753 Transcript_41018/m.64753 type:complete len:211 (+) Transcript_41018:849-1481(+)